jgi:hypothetical protein
MISLLSPAVAAVTTFMSFVAFLVRDILVIRRINAKLMTKIEDLMSQLDKAADDLKKHISQSLEGK